MHLHYVFSTPDELQLKISDLQNRPAVEPVTTYRDLTNSLSQLETKVKSLDVAVSNISLNTNRIFMDNNVTNSLYQTMEFRLNYMEGIYQQIKYKYEFL